MLFFTSLTVLIFFPIAHALINWQPCPELNHNITVINGQKGIPFDCARLLVPLDYTDPNSEPLELSLFQVNATQEPVLGTVLINFGGPGGTGAENLPMWAEQMAANIGPQWNLLSWDPRGTGRTIPFDCKIEAQATSSQYRKRHTIGLASANLTEAFLNGGWDYAGTTADQCYVNANMTGQYISTPFTARDMLRIVDALGEDGLLRYYGWSYGTALGSYAAAMFPERVDRMVLDGNVSPYDYRAGHYGDFLLDADKALAAFLTECLKNKANCSFAEYLNANKTEDLLDAINTQLQPLVSNATSSVEAFAVYGEAVQVIYQKLYFPSTWPALADTLTSFLNGSSTPPTSAASNSTAEPYNLGVSATIGIRASDAIWRTDRLEDYLPQVKIQEDVSSFDNDYPSLWVSARWKIPTKEQYKGDFQVQTRRPILYVNGEYDPVTPLLNAYRASQIFDGSVVLPHSGYGHGIAVSPSACVARHVQAYFKDGALPKAGSHCEPNKDPWDVDFFN